MNPPHWMSEAIVVSWWRCDACGDVYHTRNGVDRVPIHQWIIWHSRMFHQGAIQAGHWDTFTVYRPPHRIASPTESPEVVACLP